MERNSRKCLWLVGLYIILIIFLYILLCYSIQGLNMHSFLCFLHSFLIRNKQCSFFFKVIFYSIYLALIQVAWLQFSVAVIKNCHKLKAFNHIHLTAHRPSCSTSFSQIFTLGYFHCGVMFVQITFHCSICFPNDFNSPKSNDL